MNIPVLQVTEVGVSYGRTPVIEGFDLNIFKGETFGLIGLNGVGKTTIIKAILGLRDVNCGAIMIDGRECNQAESRKKISFLPERFDPPWFLSGLEFLYFSMRLYGVSPGRAEIYEQSERLSLDPRVLKNRVQTYSKGMRQKLGILATLLTECPLLVLDEPMSGLDPKARMQVKDMLAEIKKKNRTILLCSHILADMGEICDRLGVLSQGRLIFTGTPEELKRIGGNDNIERAFLSVIEK
ncbi:MAG: ABC transporter ATP-binding protein [Alphaproteobacteria bacterium CG_4_9_14_3_um_filter_47_13]|nr:MAG: ABC transporter ATP-binding protein [Alphaproteobacteria bacterium CG_4_9_14_3_um_filter_47_13]